MKDYLNRLPKEFLDLLKLAADIACRHNMPIYLVGGFVRDLILGVENLDSDIVVEGDGIRFAEDFASALKARLIRHRRFGTATIMAKPHLKIDIATARKEYYPEPAHLPVVMGGTLRDDLLRRDFSINAMAINIGCHDFGRLIDFYKGKEDLQNKRIRVLHALSFIDDPTRILRAVRFEKRYDFRIEPATLGLLREAAKLKMLERVEPQRVRDELILTLKEKHPVKEIRRLKDLVGFGFIDKRISVTKRALSFLNSMEREIQWFERNYQQRRPIDIWLVYFLALVDSLSASQVRSICRKFVFRRGDEKRILDYQKINRRFIGQLCLAGIKPAKIFELLEPHSYEVILAIKAKYGNARLKQHLEDFFEIYNGMRILISGEDLHKLGVLPGPRYQKIFARVLNAKLNGQIKTKEEELELIKQLIKP